MDSALSCPICGAGARAFWQHRGMRLHSCPSCGFLFADPRLFDAPAPRVRLKTLGNSCNVAPLRASKLAPTGENNLLRVGVGLPTRDETHEKYLVAGRVRIDKVNTFTRILREISAYKTTGRLLDVGSHVGGFLALARDAGFDVTGVEPNPEAAQFARNRLGLRIVQSELKTLKGRKATVDVVTLLDVLEHLESPVESIRICARLLRRGGMVAIKTPSSAYSLLKVRALDPLKRNVRRLLYLEPGGHRQYFSPRSLALACEQAGLNHIKTMGLPYDRRADGRRAVPLNALMWMEIMVTRSRTKSYFARDLLCLARKP